MKTKPLGFFLLGAAIAALSLHPIKNRAPEPLKGLPLGFSAYEKEGFVIRYDSRNKVPLWVYEELSYDKEDKRVSRKSEKFHGDLQIPSIHRSELVDYLHSGFDRGHMAAAEDHRSSKESLRDTFLLSNCCPQYATFNRGVWARLEKYVRDLSKKFDSVKVVTGPAYVPIEENGGKRISYRVIGENNVAVPTHFFKCVCLERGGELKVRAFLIPNASEKGFQELASYEVPVEHLEFLTGLIFFK